MRISKMCLKQSFSYCKLVLNLKIQPLKKDQKFCCPIFYDEQFSIINSLGTSVLFSQYKIKYIYSEKTENKSCCNLKIYPRSNSGKC